MGRRHSSSEVGVEVSINRKAAEQQVSHNESMGELAIT